MLQIIVDERLIYVVTGGVAVLGAASKIVADFSLKRMVKAAGNMSKSNHPLLRLIRAKFEHACMVSEKVENVGAFVDKYLYEYRTMGLRLHTWQRLEKICASLCISIGVLAALGTYLSNGMNEDVIRLGAYGGILGILLYLFQMTTDEKFRMAAARNYMVDYLENVCLHKYEKIQKNRVPEPDIQEIPIPQPQVQPVPEPVPPIKAFEKEEESMQKEIKEEKKEEKKAEEKKPDKDVLIRQILEEFMA